MKGWPFSEAAPKVPSPQAAVHLADLAAKRIERLTARIDRMAQQLERSHARPINRATVPLDGALITESLARTGATLAGLRAERAYWKAALELAS